MKTIYILLTRSGTLLSKLVYAATGASYTHASMAFDAELSCLYSSTRKNGYTLLPQLKCLYKGRLADLPQRKAMDLGETPSMVSIYTGLLVELLQRRAQRFFE